MDDSRQYTYMLDVEMDVGSEKGWGDHDSVCSNCAQSSAMRTFWIPHRRSGKQSYH